MDSDNRVAMNVRVEERSDLRLMLPCFNGYSKDDWSGISDPKRRKKLQNRLNQRALRQRKEAERRSSLSSSDDVSVGRDVAAIRNTSSLARLPVDEMDGIQAVRILRPNSEFTRATMHHLETLARTYYSVGSPRTDLLLRIIQFNFSKALIENIAVLGLSSEELDDEGVSPFYITDPHQRHKLINEASLPNDLQPTAVQRNISHHPWLDLLPIPRMRDNLIRAEDMYDEERLCLDMKGHGSMVTGKTGIVVWRDPWDSSGWEVSESFARDWSWTIMDCEALFRSTNYWRAQRGERPLFKLASQS